MNTLREELIKVIGKETSENRSPTLRGKLIRVNKRTCTFEVVESPYTSMKTMGSLNEDRIGEKYKVPIAYSWNAFFF
jgi:hypothetical protein